MARCTVLWGVSTKPSVVCFALAMRPALSRSHIVAGNSPQGLYPTPILALITLSLTSAKRLSTASDDYPLPLRMCANVGSAGVHRL